MVTQRCTDTNCSVADYRDLILGINRQNLSFERTEIILSPVWRFGTRLRPDPLEELTDPLSWINGGSGCGGERWNGSWKGEGWRMEGERKYGREKEGRGKGEKDRAQPDLQYSSPDLKSILLD